MQRNDYVKMIVQRKVDVFYGYDSHQDFQDGMALVTKNGFYGFIDKLGNEVIPCIYDYAESFNEERAVVLLNDKYCFINKVNKIVIPTIYQEAHSFRNGLARVKKNKGYGYVNLIGKEIVPCIYDELSDFHDNLALAKRNYKYGYVTVDGKETIPCIYDDASDFHEYMAYFCTKRRHGFMNIYGKEIVSWTLGEQPFDRSYFKNKKFHDGLLLIYKNNKFNYINQYGELLTPIYYDKANDFHNGIALVKRRGKSYYINIHGRRVDKDISKEDSSYVIESKSNDFEKIITENIIVRSDMIDFPSDVIKVLRIIEFMSFYETGGQEVVVRDSKYKSYLRKLSKVEKLIRSDNNSNLSDELIK